MAVFPLYKSNGIKQVPDSYVVNFIPQTKLNLRYENMFAIHTIFNPSHQRIVTWLRHSVSQNVGNSRSDNGLLPGGTWTNDDWWSVSSCSIYLKVISQKMVKVYFLDMSDELYY